MFALTNTKFITCLIQPHKYTHAHKEGERERERMIIHMACIHMYNKCQEQINLMYDPTNILCLITEAFKLYHQKIIVCWFINHHHTVALM